MWRRLHLAADQDESHRLRRRLSALIPLLEQDYVTVLQLIKQLEKTMDNPPACQSQLQRINPDFYRNQQIQANQLRFVFIRIHSIASVGYKYTSFLEKELASLILKAYIISH